MDVPGSDADGFFQQPIVEQEFTGEKQLRLGGIRMSLGSGRGHGNSASRYLAAAASRLYKISSLIDLFS